MDLFVVVGENGSVLFNISLLLYTAVKTAHMNDGSIIKNHETYDAHMKHSTLHPYEASFYGICASSLSILVAKFNSGFNT